jgi:hypothetical protein
MTRYKGRNSLKFIEQAFPHHVDMPVPAGGMGKRLDEIYGWHLAMGIQAVHGRGRKENGRDIIRWCFGDPKLAEAFAADFAQFTVKR